MIDSIARPMALLDEQTRPGELIQIKCARCGGGLARVFLVVGSYAEDKCHHVIQKPDGKREKCGWVTKAWPTR